MYLGPMKVYQCPKTMLTRTDLQVLDLPEIQKELNISLPHDRVSARYVQLVKLIETERSMIRSQRNADSFSKKGLNSHGV